MDFVSISSASLFLVIVVGVILVLVVIKKSEETKSYAHIKKETENRKVFSTQSNVEGKTYWLNIDLPTKKCLLHVQGCQFENKKREKRNC